MNNFIVLSTQRSGSSYLCSLLDNHPAMRCVEEIFLPQNTNEITYRHWRTASPGRMLKHWLAQQQSINAYLEDLCSRQPALDAFGFKLMYGQAKRYPAVVDWCRENDVRVVHLVRWNALKMVVSRQVALKRGFYLSTRPVDAVTVRLDTDRLISDLQKLDSLVQHNRKLFSTLPFLETSYEALMEDRDEELRRIMNFIGCDVHLQVSSDLVKTSPDSLETLIDNYGEVCERLAGSRFESYLGTEQRR